MLQNWLSQGGVPDQYSGAIIIAIKIVALLILCWIVNVIAKKSILRLVRAIIRKMKNDWDDVFVDKQVFKNVSHFAPAFVIYFFAPIWFETSPEVIDVIRRMAECLYDNSGMLGV